MRSRHGPTVPVVRPTLPQRRELVRTCMYRDTTATAGDRATAETVISAPAGVTQLDRAVEASGGCSLFNNTDEVPMKESPSALEPCAGPDAPLGGAALNGAAGQPALGSSGAADVAADVAQSADALSQHAAPPGDAEGGGGAVPPQQAQAGTPEQAPAVTSEIEGAILLISLNPKGKVLLS